MLQTQKPITLEHPHGPFLDDAVKESDSYVSRFPLKETHDPQVLVDLALSKLQSAGIQLIEWRQLLYRRMGVPVILKHHSYLVPDDSLSVASGILADMGLPPSSPPNLLLKTSGDFYAKAHLFRLTRSEAPSLVQYLMLHPLSFASYSPSELTSAPRLAIPSLPRCHTILTPRPAAVYGSILRMMTSYPRYCPTRTTLESDLSELIGYNLYGLDGGYVDIDDEDLCTELQVDQRVTNAVRTVKSWKCSGQWREEEEWIGDALVAVVEGSGEVDCLPWAG